MDFGNRLPGSRWLDSAHRGHLRTLVCVSEADVAFGYQNGRIEWEADGPPSGSDAEYRTFYLDRDWAVSSMGGLV